MYLCSLSVEKKIRKTVKTVSERTVTSLKLCDQLLHTLLRVKRKKRFPRAASQHLAFPDKREEGNEARTDVSPDQNETHSPLRREAHGFIFKILKNFIVFTGM